MWFGRIAVTACRGNGPFLRGGGYLYVCIQLLLYVYVDGCRGPGVWFVQDLELGMADVRGHLLAWRRIFIETQKKKTVHTQPVGDDNVRMHQE